jgi:hypothetical protein
VSKVDHLFEPGAEKNHRLSSFFSLFLSGFAGCYFNSSEFQVHRESIKSRFWQGLEEICRGDFLLNNFK